MFFDSFIEKFVFILVAAATVYLSFEKLYIESGLESKTDFTGWKDYITSLMESEENVLKGVFAAFVFSLVIGLLTLKSLVSPAPSY